MNKSTEGVALVKELHAVKANRRKAAIDNFIDTPVLVVKGLWLFAEGVSLLITSLYAIYQGHYAELPVWGRDALTVAGVLVLIPGALLLARFFRNASKA
jgi:hypothetical protein